MADPGTVLGIVSLVIQVAEYVDKVIAGFERIQNAPQELRDFKRSVKRLERQFDLLRKHAISEDSVCHWEDLEQIQETFILCESLFRNNEKHQNESIFSAIVRSTWSARSNEKLVKYKARIDDHYLTILIPAWLQLRIENVGSSQEVTSPGGTTHILTTQPTYASRPAFTDTILQDIARLADEVRNGHDPHDVDQKRHELGQKVRQFRVQLGLPTLDEDFPDQNSLVRRSTLTYETIPTTLLLSNAPPKHQHIELERVHIMAKDDDTRILQYQNHDNTIQVTHIIPYGSIPWTLDKSDKPVSFRRQHAITVVDSEGYHNYYVDPKYKFTNQTASNRFQSTLRERDLCGTFLAIEIKEAGNRLATRQVIRLWQRRQPNNPSTIATMTFLMSSAGNSNHREITLADYGGSAMFHNRATGRKKESDTLDVVPRVASTGKSQRRMGVLQIKFESIQEALSFKQQFSQLHSAAEALSPPLNMNTSPVVPSELPSTTKPPIELDANLFRISQERQGFVHELPADSNPPSLYIGSSISETPQSTPAPTVSGETVIPANVAPQIPMPANFDKDHGLESFRARLEQGWYGWKD